MLRTNQGKEFCSNEFNEFCTNHGIAKQLTVAYTPQQKEVAERRNRSIMNFVRSMLFEKNFRKELWAETVSWTVHVVNRSPTTIMKKKTPKEAWSGHKLLVNHFRVLGCVGHVHVPDQKIIKLEGKSVKCIILGISKKIELLNPITKKIVVNRDVIFEEYRS